MDRGIGLSSNASKFPRTTNRLQEGLSPNDFLALSGWPLDFICGRARVGFEAKTANSLRVTISHSVGEAVLIYNISVDRSAIKTLKTGRHEESTSAREMSEESLIRIRGRDVALVDNDEVDCIWVELCEDSILSCPKSMEVGDDNRGSLEFFSSDFT